VSKRKHKQTQANDDNEGLFSGARAGEWCWGGRVPHRLAGRIGGGHSCAHVGNPVGPHGLSQRDKLRRLGGAGGRVRGLARRSVARGRLLDCRRRRGAQISGRLLGSPRDAYRPGRCPARRALSRQHCLDVRHCGGACAARCRPGLIATDSAGVGATRSRSAILTGHGGSHQRRISCQRTCHRWVRDAAKLTSGRRRADRNGCGLAGAKRANNRRNRDDPADARLFRTDRSTDQPVSRNRNVDDDCPFPGTQVTPVTVTGSASGKFRGSSQASCHHGDRRRHVVGHRGCQVGPRCKHCRYSRGVAPLVCRQSPGHR
jgi:hypothetical protein